MAEGHATSQHRPYVGEDGTLALNLRTVGRPTGSEREGQIGGAAQAGRITVVRGGDRLLARTGRRLLFAPNSPPGGCIACRVGVVGWCPRHRSPQEPASPVASSPVAHHAMLQLVAILQCAPLALSMRAFTGAQARTQTIGAQLRHRMSATQVALSIEDAVCLFGRISDAQHVFREPIRTAASDFEFSSNTAIKPKWLIAYVSREPCGEDVDQPTHNTRWATLLFPDGAQACTRARFDSVLGSAEYTAPLGTPKWAVAGKVLVDTKRCAAPPSPAALDALWAALNGRDQLACEAVVERLGEWATSDDLCEAVLFSEFWGGLQASAESEAS